MAYYSMYKGIIFIEGADPSAKILQKVEYKKALTFNSQIQTLDCVKEQLAKKTLALGGNAVVDFKYGQKSYGWFKAMFFSLDDNIKWYGSGMAAILPKERAKELLDKLNKD